MVQAGTSGGLPALCLGIYSLMACIYCGKMAMNNPDVTMDNGLPTKFCWALPKNTKPTTENPNFFITDSPSTIVENATNVTQSFLSWFTWGFWLNMVYLLSTLCCVAGVTFVSSARHIHESFNWGVTYTYLGCCVVCGWMIGGLVWIILGAVMSWNEAG